MSIEITDDGATIKVRDTAIDRDIFFNKGVTNVKRVDQKILVQDDRQLTDFLFNEVTVPLAANAEALAAIIESMLETQAINSADLFLSISRGLVPGMVHVNKFGRNEDVDTGSPADVWDGGGLWVPPTTARIHDIVSSDGDDASAGTGLRTIRIEGLDINFDLQQEDLTLDGTNDVPTVNAYTRIFRMAGLTAGSTSSNVGVITATAQTDLTVTAQIGIGHSQTQMAIYTIPNNKKGYVTHAFCSFNRATGGTEQATVQLRGIINVDTATKVQRTSAVIGLSVNGSSIKDIPLKPYSEVPAKTDLIMHVESVSASNSDISAGFDLILVDD